MAEILWWIIPDQGLAETPRHQLYGMGVPDQIVEAIKKRLPVPVHPAVIAEHCQIMNELLPGIFVDHPDRLGCGLFAGSLLDIGWEGLRSVAQSG